MNGLPNFNQAVKSVLKHDIRETAQLGQCLNDPAYATFGYKHDTAAVSTAV